MIDPVDEIELKGLRSGHDEFSKLKLGKLTQMLPIEASQIAEQLPEEEEQASALRWVLRGESVERAVAKIILDRETTTRIRDRNRAKRESRESLGMTTDEIAEMKMYIERK